MKRIFVFPGQGSQFVGMGEELFPHYLPELELADRVLGYSLKDLCLKDSAGVLNKTQYTQPALFMVNVLHYLHERGFKSANEVSEAAVEEDLLLAGHSLGEYCALFAAGAFDLETGLRLVQKRGALMSEVSKGSMAAIMDIDQADVARIIAEHKLDALDVANFNSRKQTIISGLAEDISRAESAFEKYAARFIPLNVSAAFHSRYMSGVAQAFSAYMQQFSLHPLKAVVVSNLTAKPYPRDSYQELLVNQIDHSVCWYESISNVFANGVEELVEVGPGMVLTKMCAAIKADPLEVKPTALTFTEAKSTVPVKAPVYLMFAGQGTQYYGMGAQLYRENPTFKQALDECDLIVQDLLGYSIVDEIYQLEADQSFDYIQASHPAIVSFGYSLYKAIAGASEIEGVIGHSLGEYVAAIAAGVISLKDCLEMVCIQAALLEAQAEEGGLLSVLVDFSFITANTELFRDVYLAARNSPKNFMFAGRKAAIFRLHEALQKLQVSSVILPVDYAFHSPEIECIKQDFLKACQKFTFSKTTMPNYSSADFAQDKKITPDHFWRAVREPVNFQGLIDNKKFKGALMVDMSATGSLAGFIRQISNADVRYTHVVNQFGNNLTTLHSAIEMMA